jgi:hypothetical protein
MTFFREKETAGRSLLFLKFTPGGSTVACTCWPGLVDDLRNVCVFELPGFVCELRRDILSAV